jgi:hypothetical protein
VWADRAHGGTHDPAQRVLSRMPHCQW